MASALVLGATGMTGSHILSTLLSLPATKISSVDIIARRTPSSTPSSSSSGPKLNTIIDKDTATWPSHIPTPPPQIFFSALATTRGAAGGFDKQYVLEHDLNVELAKKAKENGTKTYVLISANSANAGSMLPYVRMKGEIENHIQELDFEHTIIVRPGLIGGQREESRPSEAVIRKLADVLGSVSGGRLKDFWAQDADVIARAAVVAGLRAVRGEVKDKVWYLEQKDIMRLGKHEWKGVEDV